MLLHGIVSFDITHTHLQIGIELINRTDNLIEILVKGTPRRYEIVCTANDLLCKIQLLKLSTQTMFALPRIHIP